MQFRTAVAATELAVCLPVLVTFVLGSMELANGIYLRQALTQVAYETAQVATSFGGTQASAMARGQEVLSAYGIEESSIDIKPNISAATKPGTKIEVTASAPSSANSIVVGSFIADITIAKTIVMNKL